MRRWFIVNYKKSSVISKLFIYQHVSSVMFERLAKHGRQFEAQTKDHINIYAEAGLRTLVIAYRELDDEVYKRWEEEFVKAKNSVSKDRDALVDAVADKIERDLILLGATAVEDKLQKGVNFILKTYPSSDANIPFLNLGPFTISKTQCSFQFLERLVCAF